MHFDHPLVFYFSGGPFDHGLPDATLNGFIAVDYGVGSTPEFFSYLLVLHLPAAKEAEGMEGDVAVLFWKGCYCTKQSPFLFALQERLFHFPISFNRRLMLLSPLWKTAVRCLTCLSSRVQCLLVLHREDTMCRG